MNNANDKSLESWIWDAACSIRGAQEAPKFKDFILPLIFTKRLCDVFDDELNRIAAGGRLARQGVQARREGPQARPLLPAAQAAGPRRARLVRHPQAHRQDRREPDDLPARHRQGQPRARRHHRPDGLQRHDPRPARHRRRPPLQPHRADQREAPRPQGRRGRHHRPQLRVPDPQVRRGERPVRRRVLHAPGSRPDHGPDHGPRAGHERLRPLLRLGRPAHRLRARARRQDEAAQQDQVRAAEDARPGVRRHHLGDGEHEHDHPRHGRDDRDRRHVQEPQVPRGQPPADVRPRRLEPDVEPGLVQGRGLRRRRARCGALEVLGPYI